MFLFNGKKCADICLKNTNKYVFKAANDLINDFEHGKNISIDLWNEKIGDSINYLLLLNAMVIEHELDKQKEK